MYTIDLLKGEGTPIRSRPAGIAFASLVIVVPLLVGIAMAGTYFDRRVSLSLRQQQLARMRGMVAALSEAVETRRLLEQKQTAAVTVLTDVKTSLGRHTQWSPALVTVVESLPEALILTKLEARQEFVRRKVPAKDDPKMTIEASVPVRTLAIGVCGHDKGTAYQAVRDLQDRLRSSASLGPRLGAVTVSQDSGTLDGEDVVTYELNCVFKTAFE